MRPGVVAIGDCGADALDGFRVDRRSRVAPFAAEIGEDGGEGGIVEHSPRVDHEVNSAHLTRRQVCRVAPPEPTPWTG